MYPIKKLTRAQIQRELWKSSWSVDNILQSLGIATQVTPQKLYSHVKKDIKNMNFEIVYDRNLCNAFGNQSVPAFTKFKTSNRTDGGIINLNPDYSVNERIENLIHEYIHIKDHSLPLSTTNMSVSLIIRCQYMKRIIFLPNIKCWLMKSIRKWLNFRPICVPTHY